MAASENQAAVRITVAGIPAPAGSKRSFRPGIVVEASKRTRPWQALVAAAGRDAMGDRAPFTSAVSLTAEFVFPRPKSHFRRDWSLKERAPVWHMVRPDATKLLRAIEDALTGIVWRDDALIVEQYVLKRYGFQPCCRISVRPLNRS